MNIFRMEQVGDVGISISIEMYSSNPNDVKFAKELLLEEDYDTECNTRT